LFRSKKGLKSLATDKMHHQKSITSGSPKSPSSLRYTVEPPTPLEAEVTANQSLALARALSREPTSPLTRVRSISGSVGRNNGPQVLGVSISDEANAIDDIEEDDREREITEKEENEEGGLRKTVKGLVGKLKKHTSKFDLPSLSSSSTDDVS